MSTVFDVFPGEPRIPSFAEVIDLAERRIAEYLERIGSTRSLHIDVATFDRRTEAPVPMPPTAPFGPGETFFALFTVDGVRGNSDAYFYTNDELDRECWDEEDLTGRTVTRAEVERALEVGHHWGFRRSMGQPAEIALAYGFLAAALAELTGGFIMSGDGAWDPALLPVTPEAFYPAYLNPEQGCGQWADWAVNVVDRLRGDGRAEAPMQPAERELMEYIAHAELSPPRVGLITLAVDDLDAAVRFYAEGLGLRTDGVVGTERAPKRREGHQRGERDLLGWLLRLLPGPRGAHLGGRLVRQSAGGLRIRAVPPRPGTDQAL